MRHSAKLQLSLFAIAMLGVTGSASATSHTPPAREATKIALENAVEAMCATGIPDCITLRTASNDLYKDPLVVTQQDLVRIDTLRSVFAKHDAPAIQARLATARTDLAAAITAAEILTAHVFYLHEGKWEQLNVCKMPS